VTLHEVLAGATNTPHDTVIAVSVYDTDAVAYAAAVVTNGGAALSSTAKAAFSTFIAGLKTDGLWSLMDRFAWFGNESAIAARTDIRNPAKLWSASGSPTFSTLGGYTGDGLAAYVSAVDNLTTATQFTQNAATAFVYMNNIVGTARRYQLGLTTSNNTSLADGTAANDLRAQINSTSAAAVFAPVSSPAKGLLIGTRSISTSENLYRNPTNTTPLQTGSASSTSVTAAPLCVLRSNTNYSSDRALCAGYGGDMSGLVDKLYSRVTALATALGATL